MVEAGKALRCRIATVLGVESKGEARGGRVEARGETGLSGARGDSRRGGYGTRGVSSAG